MRCKKSLGAVKQQGKLRLLPVLFAKVKRRAGQELKRRCLPISHSLIRYPDLSAFISSEHRGRYYFDSREREKIAYRWRALFHYEADVVQAADKICEHIFDLLGSGEVWLGKEIDWHTDFKSGNSWPSGRSLSSGNIVNLKNNADIKVPWELSRFQHVALLGEAYFLTENEKYAREFTDQITSWIDKNPWGCGPNWACAMDVAIRAANWILGYYFFESSFEFDEQAKLKVIKSLWEHGEFIERNLEDSVITSNHYIADLAGLFALGIFFSEHKRGRRWRDFALNALFGEMRRQVLQDGVDYEKSTCYHRLVLELFTYTFILAEKNGSEIPADVRERWERMFEFVAAYTKPDGLAPQIGDADDGMFYKFSLSKGRYPFLDHRYMLSLGAVIFNRDDFAIASGFTEETFWVFGPASKSRFENQKNMDASIGSRAFEAAGIYVLRDNDQYLVIDAGDNGMEGLGSHAHSDTLSFELYAVDKTFIVDSGTYLYSADLQARNLFRSSAYHNTVMIDGEEIHPIIPNWLFALPDAGGVRVTRWNVDGDTLVFEAEHDAYCRLSEPVTHRRRICFDKAALIWRIEDCFEGNGMHKFESRLHFAPGIELMKVSNTRCFETLCEGARLRIEADYNGEFEAEVEDSWYSPSYGYRISNKTLRFAWNGGVPCRFGFTFRSVDS